MEDHDIYRVFEQVKPTRSQEEAMLERLFLEERKGRPMKLMKKTIAVLAAAALLLTTCAFAAVTGLGRQVLDYFGVRQEDEALFSQEWEPVGLSHTFQNGWTVDVNQMYTGLYSAAILVDVTAPEGVVLDGDNYSLKYWWEETDNPWPPRIGGRSLDYLPDGNSADGKVSFLITAVCLEDPVSLLGLETKFYPYRLTEYSEGVEETFDFVGGHWTTDLTITLSEQASGFVQSVGQPLTVEGEEVLLDSVYLSPIAAFYGIRPSGDDPFSDSIWEVMISSNDASPVLTTQSGETVRMAEQVYGRAAGETETVSYGMFERTYALPGCTFARVGYRPERVFDPAEIASITILGQTFPLDGLVPVES